VNIPLFAILLLLGALGHFLPGWTRPDLFFAVTVHPDFRTSDAARRILRRYRLIVWTAVAAALATQFAAGTEAAILISVAGFVCALADAHRQMLPHAATTSAIVEVDISATAEGFPGGWLTAILPSGSLAVLALWVVRHWERLPQRFPTHWNWYGPGRWVERTPAAVYGFLAMQAAISVVLVVMAWGILRWSRRVVASGPNAGVERRFRKLNVQLLVVMSYLPAVQAWLVFLRTGAPATVWALVVTVVAAVYVAVLIPYRQGGGRARRPAPGELPTGDRTPDACWKWGMFYFNPGDPSVFIAKRFGIGYTVNFGNRWTWVVLAGLVLLKVFLK